MRITVRALTHRLFMSPAQESANVAARTLPRHIAIVMDGNGRWARRRLLPRPAGHREGVKSVQRVVQACVQQGVAVLTLFAFSSENWRRPETEVSVLMDLFITTLRSEAKRLHNNNVRLRFIGDRTAFSDKLRGRMDDAEALTANNTGLTLVIAANYGGQWDMAEAAKSLAEACVRGEMTPADITPEAFGRHVALADLPAPDLFIRTGGETRISNFMLWQLAYAELYFTPTLWPDFDEAALDKAITAYAGRERRYGKTSEQLTHDTD